MGYRVKLYPSRYLKYPKGNNTAELITKEDWEATIVYYKELFGLAIDNTVHADIRNNQMWQVNILNLRKSKYSKDLEQIFKKRNSKKRKQELESLIESIEQETREHIASIEVPDPVVEFMLAQGLLELRTYMQSDKIMKQISREIRNVLLPYDPLDGINIIEGVTINKEELPKDSLLLWDSANFDENISEFLKRKPNW